MATDPELQSANLRKMYMDRVSTMPLYGSVQMPVQYALNSTIWTRYTLAITQKGIQLIEGYSTVCKIDPPHSVNVLLTLIGR